MSKHTLIVCSTHRSSLCVTLLYKRLEIFFWKHFSWKKFQSKTSKFVQIVIFSVILYPRKWFYEVESEIHRSQKLTQVSDTDIWHRYRTPVSDTGTGHGIWHKMAICNLDFGLFLWLKIYQLVLSRLSMTYGTEFKWFAFPYMFSENVSEKYFKIIEQTFEAVREVTH